MKNKTANDIAFGQEPIASVEYFPSPDGGEGETLITIEHGIAVRTYTTLGKLTKVDALSDYKKGAWSIDFPDQSNAVGDCIGILRSHGWIEETAPFAPLQSHIQNFEAEMQNTDLATWEIERGMRSRFTALVWAIEKAGLRYEPEWYAAQILRYFEGPSEAAFIAGYMFRELTLRYRHEKDAIRGKKTKKGAAQGGKMRLGAFKKEKGDILKMMHTYIENGCTITAAARHTYGNGKGLGVSTEANRKLFYRHKS